MSFRDILNQPLPSQIRVYHVPDMEYYGENTYSHEKMHQKKLRGADISVRTKEGPLPHFHLVWGDGENPDKTCCIRFDKSLYFFHPEHERTDVPLENKQKKELISILKSKHKQNDIPREYHSVWELMIYWWNLLGKDNNEMIELPINLPIPDYTKIEKEKTNEDGEVDTELISKCFARLKNEK